MPTEEGQQYLARLAEAQRKREMSLTKFRIDMRDPGVEVDGPWDLLNKPIPVDVLPTLFTYLVSDELDSHLKNGLARAFASRSAIAWWSRIKELFQKTSPSAFRDGLAVALAAMATPAETDELIEMIKDVRLGSSRILLLAAFRRVNTLKMPAGLLEELKDDVDLSKEIQYTLRNRNRRK